MTTQCSSSELFHRGCSIFFAEKALATPTEGHLTLSDLGTPYEILSHAYGGVRDQVRNNAPDLRDHDSFAWSGFR